MLVRRFLAPVVPEGAAPGTDQSSRCLLLAQSIKLPIPRTLPR